MADGVIADAEFDGSSCGVGLSVADGSARVRFQFVRSGG
jgi:hypothetical protein